MQRQAWYADYQRDQHAEPLAFISKFKAEANPSAVADDIRKTLCVDIEKGQRRWDAYQRELIEGAERAGILVMRSGMVGNNTRRTLDVSEFRGFAISHPLAPVIFINSADAPAARLFTLLHELAHLWLGSSGISSGAPGAARQEEIACNAIAGEFLAPAEVFREAWTTGSNELALRRAELAQRFHVSQIVIMRRALDLDLLDRESYQRFYVGELEKHRQAKEGGGGFYRTARSKNSKRFSEAVLAETFSGRLLLREAGQLLGIQPAKLRNFSDSLKK